MSLAAGSLTGLLVMSDGRSSLWLALGFPLLLAVLGLPWRISGRLALLGVIGSGAFLTSEVALHPGIGGLLMMAALAVGILFGAKPFRWIFVAAGVVAALIGSFSGQLGSAGRMFRFFTEKMQIDPQAAETLVFVIRKSVHVTCYGVLASLIFWLIPPGRRHRWLGATLAALAFAVFDETRQTFAPGRTGSLLDIGWDMLGIALVLGAVHGFLWRNQRPSGFGPDS